METLAPVPANAENTASVETGNADANPVEANGDGTAPSVPEADTSAPKVKEDPVQKRIDQLTREKYDALRDRDRETYQRESLQARLEALEKAKPAEVAPQDDFPTLEKFGYDEGKFNAAVAAHYSKLATEQARTVAQDQIRAEREAEQARKIDQNWATKEAEFIKLKPDYVEKVQMARTLPISREIQIVLKGSELGPQVAYHLVENAEVATAIMRMPPEAQLMEVGRIMARLESTKIPAKPAVSQAPPPVGKVDADEAVVNVKVDSAESDNLSDKEWTRRRNAQEQARLRKLRGS